MIKPLFTLLAGCALLAALPPAQAESGEYCASQCVSSCSGDGVERDDQRYSECLDACLPGCFDKPMDIPEVPAPTPVED